MSFSKYFKQFHHFIFVKKHSRFFWEALSITALALIVYLFAIEHDAFEYLVELSEKHEDWELDELFALAIIMSFALTAMVVRNSKHLKIEFEKRSQAESKIKKMAFFDSLTGLPNRDLCNDRLQHTLTHSKRLKKQSAILFIDIDNFKEINDTYGHHNGDEILKQIAKRFSGELRADDTLARIAGDEFVVIVESVETPAVITVLAEKLLAIMQRAFVIDGDEIYVSNSIGIAISPVDGDNAADLLKSADRAMYHAKDEGKSTFRFFSTELDLQAKKKLKISAQLRMASDANEFTLNYQPVVDVKNGEITGAEALIRWNNPVLGFVGPDIFIPIAEEIGLIGEIGDWVLREACKQTMQWQNKGHRPIKMSVNMSARQLSLDNYVNSVKAVLQETQLAPQYLELELTETAIMKDIDSAILKLDGLKQLGISLALDDFGTGYSSMSHLRKLRLSRLKVDRSFIMNIPKNIEDIATANAIISLAENLGLRITAEGVETKEQVAYLKSTACDSIQGYFFSRPVPADEFEKLLFSGIETFFTPKKTTNPSD